MGQIDSIAGRLIARSPGMDTHGDTCSTRRSLDQELQLKETMAQLRTIEVELQNVRKRLCRRDEQVATLEEEKSKLSEKCSGLQRYVRKLTSKCDRWESFLDQESRVLHNLKVTNSHTLQQASELAIKYKKTDMVSTRVHS